MRDGSTVGRFEGFADIADNHGNVTEPFIAEGSSEGINAGHRLPNKITVKREVLNGISR